MLVLLSSCQTNVSLFYFSSILKFYEACGELSSERTLVFFVTVLFVGEFDQFHATLAPISYSPGVIPLRFSNIVNYVCPN